METSGAGPGERAAHSRHFPVLGRWLIQARRHPARTSAFLAGIALLFGFPLFASRSWGGAYTLGFLAWVALILVATPLLLMRLLDALGRRLEAWYAPRTTAEGSTRRTP